MDNETEPLLLKHVMLSFLIFFASLGLGLVAFIFELGYFKCTLCLRSRLEGLRGSHAWSDMRSHAWHAAFPKDLRDIR